MKELLMIEGTVEDIVYQNEANGYTVCEIMCDNVLTTAVGCMPQLAAGESARLTGEWTTHHEYGEQFKVQYFEKLLPSTVSSILIYLASGIIKGVREATAKKIVTKFGDKSLDIIRDEPLRLAEITGITKIKAQEISASFVENNATRHTLMFLQPFGITTSLALKAHKLFGDDAVEQIKRDPYILCERISGVGFLSVDRIAHVMGIENSHDGRLRSGIKYILMQAAISEGHTFLPYSLLVEQAINILGVDELTLSNLLTKMRSNAEIYAETKDGEENYYLLPYYNAELGVAKRLLNLQMKDIKNVDEKIASGIKEAEEESGITLSDEQKFAVNQAVYKGVLVITGGPGTGKTTIIKTIIKIMDKLGLDVCLTAPTGRATKRMSEMCGISAKTIHRLLEIGRMDDDEVQQFSRDENNPIEASCVIVDEMSMVDILLMNSLLRAVATGTRLIMVGDVDQLPSVGAGIVLRDIIDSKAVTVVRLNEIYRQAAKSMIVLNAHRVNKGEYPYLNAADKDFFFMPRATGKAVAETVVELFAGRLTKAYGFDALNQIQALTPVRKTAIGVFNLNKELQKKLNPPNKDKAERIFHDTLFRDGDKIMQIKNNYTLTWQREGEEGFGVFNGDIGYIKHIDINSRVVSVVFDDDKSVNYEFMQMDELELAYSITVHKSQGSEFPCVVIPVFSCAPRLMTRNLLYTAITRAKQLVVLVGQETALYRMINNNDEMKRYSSLVDKLKAGDFI